MEPVELLDKLALMMRGMTMDPAIPDHAKEALQAAIKEAEDAVAEHYEKTCEPETNNREKAEHAEFKPNYKRPCQNCDQMPTVDIFVNGKLQDHMDLCGVCTWGEADCIDPENW